MIEQIELSNFKGFKALTIGGARQINIIVGDNNAGKTAVLEALDLVINGPCRWSQYGKFRDPTEEETPLISAGFGRVTESISREKRTAEWIFYLLPITRSDQIGHVLIRGEGVDSGVFYAGGSMTEQLDAAAGIAAIAEINPRVRRYDEGFYQFLQLKSGEDSNAAFVTAWPASSERANALFENVAIRPAIERMIEGWLKELDSRVRSVRSLKLEGRPRQIFVDIGQESRIPLTQLGQGSQRLLMIASKAAEAGDMGVLLIDEIDAGFHHAFLETLWRTLFRISVDLNLQIFATTHSYECIHAAAKVAGEIEGEQLAIHRIERKGEATLCVSASERTLIAAIKSGFEVR